MLLSWPIIFVIPSFFCLLVGKKRIAYMTLSFFAPFTATSAINVMNEDKSGSGLSISWLILILFCIYYSFKSLNVLKKTKFIFPKKQNLRLAVLGYWFFCLISFFIFYLTKTDYLEYDDFIFKSPGFDISNITRFCFFSIGIFFSLQFAKKASEKDITAILDAFIAGTTIACILGLFDYFTKNHIAAHIFNTNVSVYAQGYTAEGKISGPAVEPSLLIQVIGISLAISLCKLDFSRRVSILQQKLLFTSIAIQFLTVILASAHTSILVLMALGIQLLFGAKAFLMKYVLLVVSALIFGQYLFTLTDKLSTFSGIERVGSIFKSFEAFLERPVFGYGFSEVTSHDLFVNSLANTGVFSTILLLSVIMTVLITAINSNDNMYFSYAQKASLWCFLNLVLVMCFSGFSHPYVHFYLALAVSLWSFSSIKSNINTTYPNSGVDSSFKQKNLLN